MKILVRLPNWLGDMVMAVGFIHQLHQLYPKAEISIIVKKGLEGILEYYPPLSNKYLFNKEEYKGSRGLWKFGRKIKKGEKCDLFFSLPNSFSSALMGLATGAKKRVGYKNELRSILLTNSYKQPKGIHRAEEYTKLLELYTRKQLGLPTTTLTSPFTRKDYIVVNINSEASSRRLTITKASDLINKLIEATSEDIVLVGSPKEKEFIDTVVSFITKADRIRNRAGQTNLTGLAELLGSAKLVVSTDSGPAHLANALGTYTIVLFGAGDEAHTAPYNKDLRTVIRLGELSCEPCEKNVCHRFGIPQCLEQLNIDIIVNEATKHLYGAKPL
jgi:ADP-heptose:LPS heptosyltransferase